MVDAELLRRIRNDLPMAVTIAALGRKGPPSKLRDGRFVFLCPTAANCSPANVRVYLGANFTSSGEPGTFQDLNVFGGVALTDGVFVG